MATKAASQEELRALRGTKRTCQNDECGSRFYDLNRDPITCPICGTVYALALRAPQPAPAPVTAKKQPRPVPKDVDVEGEKPEPDEELAAVAGEEGDEAAEGDEVFLEEMEEEPANVTEIIDAPIEDREEKS